MANTAVVLKSEDGVLVAGIASIPVVTGDTITFSTDDGSAAYAFFSPAALAILSPAPPTPFKIDGATAALSFTSSDAGAYSVFFETDSAAVPPPFPVTKSSLLLLNIDPNGTGFGTADTHTKKG